MQIEVARPILRVVVGICAQVLDFLEEGDPGRPVVLVERVLEAVDEIEIGREAFVALGQLIRSLNRLPFMLILEVVLLCILPISVGLMGLLMVPFAVSPLCVLVKLSQVSFAGEAPATWELSQWIQFAGKHTPS